MSETQSDPIDVSKFKNGDDVHFDYNSTTNDQTINSTNVQKKKKKKKSKNKHKGSPNVEATLNDPDVEYPTSRVIKQAPNGDVIIESLDEPSDAHTKSVTANIWDNATLEEQENLKAFWESLDEAQKIELVKIDKKSIMDIFKNESKTVNTLNNHQNNSNTQGGLTSTSGGALNGSSTNVNIPGAPSNSSNGACTCSYCGRKNNFIEDELENIYDNHFDDIIDFIHEVRDINDLNALPGLLFGGFHMLEEEHKLQKRQQKYKYKQERDAHHDHHNHEPGHICSDTGSSGDYDGSTQQDQQHQYEHEIEHAFQEDEHEDECGHKNDHSHSHSHSHTENHNHSHSYDPNHNHSHSHFQYDQIEELNNEDELSQEAVLQKSLDDELNKELGDESNNNQLSIATKEQRVFHKLLDPKLFEALENLDFEKMKDTPANNHLAHILEKAGSLRDIIRDLHKADKVELEKGMAFLQNMGKIFSSDMSNAMNHDTLNDQISNGLSSFAEDLLKNDGNSFIDMMESLSESRTAREDLLKEKFDKEPSAAWIDEDDHTKSDTDISIPKPDLHQVQELEEELNDEYDEVDEDEEDEDDDEGEEEEEEELDDEEFEEDEEEDASDTESEISEEEKMQEIRRLFLIQVIKLFQERLKNAYKEKLSQDRTRTLIEELEAEENAKKEREMKKLRQKEKAKEKKRLQQLAKEEERRKKEEEQKAKEEELKQKQEALRAEQRRKKEEAKQKREEEKRKRIEELKRKELEHQKRLEAQRKKEEETKKLKDEKKKKIEEERKQKEEEKRQKELQKKLVEEERSKSAKKQDHKETGSSEDISQLSRDLENARLGQNFNIPSPVVPDTLLAQPQEPRVKSPTKNHILDQLYLAKPRSLSNSTNSTPQINNVTPGYIPDLSSNSMLPSVLSPSGHNILPNNGNVNNQAVPSPWSSQAFNANTQAPPVYQPQLSSNAFSPFNSSLSQNSLSSNANENLNTNPLNTTGFNEPFATAAQPSSVWNPGATSRNNSIWSNSPNVASNSTLWGNSVPAPPVGAAVGGNPNSLDSDLIQAAAYQAFQFLQNSNQLEFGVAPSLKLFQTAKTILSNQGLTLNQFLTSCRNTGSLSGYGFDFIYDDFGTVTHIKASSTNIPQQPPHNNVNTQSINSLGLGNAAVNDNESSLLNTLSDINNNPNSFSNGVRGLWN